MLKLSLPKLDVWNPDKEVFEDLGSITVELEHSLYTIAGWESKWKKPFANNKGLAHEEFIDYIMNFMCQTPNVPKTAWLSLNQESIQKVNEYIEDPSTATTIKRNNFRPKGSRREIVTAELIYYYMTQLNIPFECEHWHLNRLMTLIEVGLIKSSPPKKMGRREAAALQAKQNAEMRAKLGSRG